MNKRALVFGALYCLLYIIFKLVILLGGYTLSKFGYYYSVITGVFLIIPFFFFAIYQVREKDYNGVIGGREAVRIALTVLVIGLIGTTLYNYIEFNWKIKDLSVAYFKSEEFLDILKKEQVQHPDKLKAENFPSIIETKISELSAFRAATGKLVPLLFLGLGGAFTAAMFLKRASRQQV